MRIKSVEIEKYRRLQHCRVEVASTKKNFLINDLYGKLGITLVAGPNGSGKTSFLSFIAQVFHNMERFPERINGEFEICYQDVSGRECVLYRKPGYRLVFLRVQGEFDLPVWEIKPDIHPEQNVTFVCYDDIKKYLPPVIIVSAFSLHGEYPSIRPKNFVGDRRLAVFDTSNLYGRNHFGFPSFSRSICLLMNSVKRKTAGIQAFEKLLGAKFTGKVLVHERGYYVEADNDDWIPYSKEVEHLEKSEIIYVNDIQLKTKSGDELRLSNMSSGQKMLFIRILTILGKICDGALILVEEPEIHLDPAWSRQLVSLLLLFFKDFNAYIIIATHSFSLINAVPTECVLFAKDGSFTKPPVPTMLANESALAGLFYDAELHEVERKITEYFGAARVDELQKLFALLGESNVRFEVFSQIKKKFGENNA